MFLLGLLVVPCAAEEPAPGIDLHVVTRLRDETVARAIEPMVKAAELDVAIDERVRNRRVTLDIDAPIVVALDRIAKAAGAHLWKIADGKYALRLKPPPASAVVPPEELVIEESDEADTAPEPDPPWMERIAKALEIKADLGKPRRIPLADALADLARQAGVPLHIDPDVLKSKTLKGVEIEYWDPLGDSSVGDLLLLFCSAHDLGYLIRWGVVFVTSHARFFKLPEELFVSGSEKLPEGTAKTFATHLVTCSRRKTPLTSLVAALAADAGLEIAFSKKARKACRKLKPSVTFTGRKLEHALAILLVPAGLGLKYAEGGLEVVRR
jgi:hypothetical protein